MKEATVQALTSWLLGGGATINSLEEVASYLKKKGGIEDRFLHEVLRQRDILHEKREEVEAQHKGKVVVVCQGEIFVGRTFREAVRLAENKYPDAPYYSESIGRIDYPSVVRAR